MPQATRDIDTPRVENAIREFPVAAGARLFAGAIVCINASSLAVRGDVSTTLTAVGRCEEQADNTLGAAGAIRVRAATGVFRYGNSAAGDAITLADVDKACFIVDDNTVAKTNGSNTRSQAGIVRNVDASGVWVEIGQAR
jgi:hypothetical protein